MTIREFKKHIIPRLEEIEQVRKADIVNHNEQKLKMTVDVDRFIPSRDELSARIILTLKESGFGEEAIGRFIVPIDDDPWYEFEIKYNQIELKNKICIPSELQQSISEKEIEKELNSKYGRMHIK